MIRPPIVLTDSVSLSAIAAGFGGAYAKFNTASLMNVMRIPIEIHHLGIFVESRSARGMSASMSTYLDVKLGRHYLTDGPVPIAVLAPFKEGSDQDEPISPATSDYFEVDNAGTRETNQRRRVMLPKPLILPPGMGFNVGVSIPPSEFISLFATDFSVIVHFTAVGRWLDGTSKIPRTNEIPIISHVQLSQSKRRSLEGDLRNPLSGPMKVHRIIGSTILATGGALLNTTMTSNGTTIDLRFPDNSRMVEEAADFPRVFGQCRTWPAKFDLPPNARVGAEISANAAETPDPLYGYQVALFGTRSEAI